MTTICLNNEKEKKNGLMNEYYLILMLTICFFAILGSLGSQFFYYVGFVLMVKKIFTSLYPEVSGKIPSYKLTDL